MTHVFSDHDIDEIFPGYVSWNSEWVRALDFTSDYVELMVRHRILEEIQYEEINV